MGLEEKGREWKGADWFFDRTQRSGPDRKGGEGIGRDWIGSLPHTAEWKGLEENGLDGKKLERSGVERSGVAWFFFQECER